MHHLKACSSRETYIYIQNTLNILLTCCNDAMAETTIIKVKEAIFSIFGHEASNGSNTEQLSFCLRYVNDDGDRYLGRFCGIRSP